MAAVMPLIAIVGETASGKSALAMEIAEHYHGEIIAADSRTIYKGMDIGTGKPTAADQRLVPHHGLDLVWPGESYTAANFQRYAREVIHDIGGRGKLPILVGGSGLYLDSVIYNYAFDKQADSVLRDELSAKSISELQAILTEGLIPMPTNPLNKRHLIRQIETGGVSQIRELRPNTLILGIEIEKDVLEQNVIRRVDAMFTAGLTREAEVLATAYSWNSEPMKGIGYREFHSYFEGQESLDGIREMIIKDTLQLAKRQRTWFRRNKSIHWIQKENYVDLVTTFLNK